MSRFFLRDPFSVLLSLLCCVLIAGCGSKEETKTGEEPSSADSSKTANENSPSQSSAVDDPAEQLKADLDDAISLLEKGEMALFLERYVPLEVLEQMRKESRPSRRWPHNSRMKLRRNFSPNSGR